MAQVRCGGVDVGAHHDVLAEYSQGTVEGDGAGQGDVSVLCAIGVAGFADGQAAEGRSKHPTVGAEGGAEIVPGGFDAQAA